MASTVDAKLLKATKFPPFFNEKVDMQKVNTQVMRKWIANRISQILGEDDDVTIELCFNLLEESRHPNIKHLQIQLTGFLEKDTPAFCEELWKLCLSAQSSPQGVPKELLEAKKLELRQEKLEATKAAEEAKRRREEDRIRELDLNNMRQQERGDRSRGRGGFGRDRRGSPRRDRSPRRRRNSPPPRAFDTYVPRGSTRRDDRPRRPVPGEIDLHQHVLLFLVVQVHVETVVALAAILRLVASLSHVHAHHHEKLVDALLHLHPLARDLPPRVTKSVAIAHLRAVSPESALDLDPGPLLSVQSAAHLVPDAAASLTIAAPLSVNRAASHALLLPPLLQLGAAVPLLHAQMVHALTHLARALLVKTNAIGQQAQVLVAQ
ncbi:hypothetical protein BT63DRAFT_436190 [Microthyrium microscopicum]|uniref:PWI domain-containing protein n=1 Tax=Microthyrium microscopicum TaxID=703497 RepID=A0A6A6UUZ6_9PEZI|nr:hypothetical protein BT63DRAFT_436190 [Microthyrium microscopicum]